MFRVLFALLFVYLAQCDDYKIVYLDQGGVNGTKYWNGDFYEFYGVPYARAPKGRERFLGPLPPPQWDGVKEANIRSIICKQPHVYEGVENPEIIGQNECLVLNLLVPTIASEINLVPVLVYIHSGGYAVGHANMARYHYLARYDVIVISINYRLGALGFACLGTEEIPGNAGLKDQVAALKWINKNIRKFGGDPNKVTVAGYSVGAAMVELLALSRTTDGLFNQIILESGSALAPFAVNADPINTARNIAKSIGFNDTKSMYDLNEFYLLSTDDLITSKTFNFVLPNSTFGFAPCIETIGNSRDPFLTESPISLIKNGNYRNISIVSGFSNMEGLSRSMQFDDWSEKMNGNFDDFIPADLKFKSDKEKKHVANKVKKFYFAEEEVSFDNVKSFVDYFSDSMFINSILKSAVLHASNKRNVYLYEFDYVGKLNIPHRFTGILKGASHRDQTSYILDFYSYTSDYSDLDTRDRMTRMWTDFVKEGNPTPYENILMNYKWLKYTKENQNYLEINSEVKNRNESFLNETFRFWEELYEKYYWNL